MKRFWDKVESLFFDRKVDISSMVFFRIGFGTLMLYEVVRYALKEYIRGVWISPDHHYHFMGFSWVTPFDGIGMYIVFILLGLSAFLIAIGLLYRLAAIAFFILFTYIFLAEMAYYLNHFYLICMVAFWMIFVPANKWLSVDALIWPKIKTTKVPSWSLWMLMFLIGMPYFFGGIAKIHPDWIAGEPMRTWLGRNTDFPFIGQYFRNEFTVKMFSYGGIIFDTSIVFLLMWRWTRIPAFILTIGFHLFNAKFFGNIGVFPYLMIAASTIFFDPEWFRMMLSKINGSISWLKKLFNPDRSKSWLTRFVVAFFVIQCLLPFRHFLYPGDVLWTDEGHEFSWRMKMRSKDGNSTFYVTIPETGERERIRNRDYLSSRQINRIPKRPEFAIQFAKILEKEYKDRGVDDIIVTAEVYSKINGKPAVLLIDPEVDLTEVKWTMAKSTWILDR